MTLEQIKSSVLAGNPVYWLNPRYEVIQDSSGQWLIQYDGPNYESSFISLTWSDGVTLNGKESDFYPQVAI